MYTRTYETWFWNLIYMSFGTRYLMDCYDWQTQTGSRYLREIKFRGMAKKLWRSSWNQQWTFFEEIAEKSIGEILAGNLRKISLGESMLKSLQYLKKMFGNRWSNFSCNSLRNPWDSFWNDYFRNICRNVASISLL